MAAVVAALGAAAVLVAIGIAGGGCGWWVCQLAAGRSGVGMVEVGSLEADVVRGSRMGKEVLGVGSDGSNGSGGVGGVVVAVIVVVLVVVVVVVKRRCRCLVATVVAVVMVGGGAWGMFTSKFSLDF